MEQDNLRLQNVELLHSYIQNFAVISFSLSIKLV